jgi:hypothetical protein
MKTTGDKLFSEFEKILTTAFPEVGLPKIRKVCQSLSNQAVIEVNASTTSFQQLYADVSIKNEQHKAHFRTHIEYLDKNTGVLMQRLYDNNIVIKQIDRKTGKTILKANSLFAKELVLFLERLDESVQKFYSDVYEIKDKSEAKEHGFQQNTLF